MALHFNRPRLGHALRCKSVAPTRARGRGVRAASTGRMRRVAVYRQRMGSPAGPAGGRRPANCGGLQQHGDGGGEEGHAAFLGPGVPSWSCLAAARACMRSRRRRARATARHQHTSAGLCLRTLGSWTTCRPLSRCADAKTTPWPEDAATRPALTGILIHATATESAFTAPRRVRVTSAGKVCETLHAVAATMPVHQGAHPRTFLTGQPAGLNCTAECPTTYGSVCASKGTCVQDGPNGAKCECFPGFRGGNCTVECVGGAARPCSKRGICEEDGSCTCLGGWRGDDCSIECPGSNVFPCNMHGKCMREVQRNPEDDSLFATCQCDPLYRGKACEYRCPDVLGMPCGGRGVCNSKGECECNYGYRGEDCMAECPVSLLNSPFLSFGETTWPDL